jgi:hypothetical protein
MAGYCLGFRRRSQSAAAVPTTKTPALPVIDLDRLLGALGAELALSAFAAEQAFHSRLARRKRRVLPEWLSRAMKLQADQTSDAAEMLQPTRLVGVGTLLLEAEVQLSEPLDIDRDQTRLVYLQILPERFVLEKGGCSTMRIRMDGAAQGEVRLGALEAAIVAGKRTGQWKRWDCSAMEPPAATETIHQ